MLINFPAHVKYKDFSHDLKIQASYLCSTDFWCSYNHET